MLRYSYNVDFGYISLFEVIGIVAAYAATLPIAQAESSLMMVYVNRNVLEHLL